MSTLDPATRTLKIGFGCAGQFEDDGEPNLSRFILRRRGEDPSVHFSWCPSQARSKLEGRFVVHDRTESNVACNALQIRIWILSLVADH